MAFRQQMGKDKQHESWLRIVEEEKNNSQRKCILISSQMITFVSTYQYIQCLVSHTNEEVDIHHEHLVTFTSPNVLIQNSRNTKIKHAVPSHIPTAAVVLSVNCWSQNVES